MGRNTYKQTPFGMINTIMRFGTGRTGTVGKAPPVLLGGRQFREGGTEGITLESRNEQ